MLGLVVAAVGMAEVRGWPFLREPLQQRLQSALGVPVRIGTPFRASLLGPPWLRAGHLHVGAGSGIAVPHLVEAGDVQIAWRWVDLWRAWRGSAPLTLRQVVAGELDARLVRLADGRASWRLGPGRAEPSAQDDPRGGLPRFGWLQVSHGRIVVDDQPSATELGIELEGGEGEAAGTRDSGYRARVQGRWKALPLDLRMQSGAALPLLREEGGPGDDGAQAPLQVKGRAGAATVSFDGRVGALFGLPRFDGTISIDGPSLGRVAEPFGLTLPQTPPFELRGRLAQAGGVWDLHVERAALGRSRLLGDFRYDTRASPPRLSGRVSGPRLALADLAPAVGVPVAPPPGPRTRVLPQRQFNLPSLAFMQADVQVAVDELDLGSTAIAPLRELRTQVLLKDSVLQWRDLHAVVAGGRVDGSTLLDARGRRALWKADLKLDRVDIDRWLPVLRKAPQRGAKPGAARAWMTGTLNGQLQVQGEGTSTARILSTLDGRASAVLRDGTLSHLATEGAGLDVAQALGVWMRGDAPLPLRCARVQVQVKDGVATLQQAVMDNADSTLRVAGKVDLRDESLALVARTRPKDFSPFSLRAPVTVSGTMAHPEVGLDSRRLAGKVIGSVVLGAVVAPLAALLPMVDPGSKDEGPNC